jgi:hypothetical protein
MFLVVGAIWFAVNFLLMLAGSRHFAFINLRKSWKDVAFIDDHRNPWQSLSKADRKLVDAARRWILSDPKFTSVSSEGRTLHRGLRSTALVNEVIDDDVSIEMYST